MGNRQCSERPRACDLVLCSCFFEILNFILEYVFCRWSPRRWDGGGGEATRGLAHAPPTFLAALPLYVGPTSWGYLAPIGLTVPTPCQVRPLLPSTHFCTHTHPQGPRKVKVGQDRVVAHSMGNSAVMLVSIQVLGAPLCLEMVICCGLGQWIYGKGRSLAYLPTLAGAQFINPVPGWSREPALSGRSGLSFPELQGILQVPGESVLTPRVPAGRSIVSRLSCALRETPPSNNPESGWLLSFLADLRHRPETSHEKLLCKFSDPTWEINVLILAF